MLRSQHPRDTELLMAVDGELSHRRQVVVDEHVSACLACRSRFQQIRTTLAQTTACYESTLGPPSPPFRSSRLRLEHALRKAANDRNRPWLDRLRFAMAVSQTRATLAMAIVAVLVAGVWMSRTSDLVQAPRPELGTPLPIATLTPGAVSSLTAVELCAGTRPSRLVTPESRTRVLRAYGMETVSTHTYELDALITPELGGTTAPENLWPQPYASPVWNARVKDELEELLPTLVCAHHVELAQAQREIASDWVAAYKRYFKTDVPLQAHIGAPLADDDDLDFVPVPYVAENSAPMALRVRFLHR